MITPFRLTNAPSTFQKYINWTLREYLDDFVSAYIDDILIYTDGSRSEHRQHVRKVLAKLHEAGLQLDIDKSEFEVKSTKYLGFIVEAGEGVRMDPAKVEAVLKWEAPQSVKGVQSFLGFANFYRPFIKDFSKVAGPLIALVRKDTAFHWTEDAEKAFKRMKKMFIAAPMLAQFHEERETIVETDVSNWCVGATLLQYQPDGVLRPCAFFSKKNAPAECNYEIYDKEMLAIVRALEAWDAELRSVKSFVIRTDHKNLEYFMTVRKLTERQMRWSHTLSRYNFQIEYVTGKSNVRADALSRREQDVKMEVTDARLQAREMQLLKPEVLPRTKGAPVQVLMLNTQSPLEEVAVPESVDEPSGSISEGLEGLEDLWTSAKEKDQVYQDLVEAVREQRYRLPSHLGIKVSINDCALSEQGELLFRGRRWVPDLERLRTSLIQQTHDSVMTGHPGREITAALLARQFFWPNMLSDVRRFVRNCDMCGRSKVWRERKQGFLKPMPIPDRVWSEISMDFIVDLPLSDGCTNLMVITDRLSKGVILSACPDITAETVAKIFIRDFYRLHGLPKAIVSDRGTQFTGLLWTRVCALLKVVRRLSTAFHPQTDGSTERMNDTVEVFFRVFVNYDQDNWVALLPMAELAINNRNAASTGVSPFFLAHGYHATPLEVPYEEVQNGSQRSPVQKANALIQKMKEATEWAQSAMAMAQQIQEEQANRTRQQGTAFKVGDKAWLDLRNVRTTRANKKMDVKYAKYTITEVIGSHSFRLDTPPGIRNVFHSDLLRLASSDPLPSQLVDDSQPAPVIVDDENEWEIERIEKHRTKRRGRGQQLEYLVKWKGYARPTWEAASALEETEALDVYERSLKQNDISSS